MPIIANSAENYNRNQKSGVYRTQQKTKRICCTKTKKHGHSRECPCWLLGVNLFQLNGSANLSQLSLQSLSVSGGHCFLNGSGSAVNDSLSFLQTQAGSLTNGLDHLNLVGANIGQHNIKLGLLLFSRSSSTGTATYSDTHKNSTNTAPTVCVCSGTGPTGANGWIMSAMDMGRAILM